MIDVYLYSRIITVFQILLNKKFNIPFTCYLSMSETIIFKHTNSHLPRRLPSAIANRKAIQIFEDSAICRLPATVI